MTNKELENKIKSSIEINFVDHTSKLIEYNNHFHHEKSRRYKFRYCIYAFVVFIICGIFLYKTELNNNNMLNINDVLYINNSEKVKYQHATNADYFTNVEKLPELFLNKFNINYDKVKNIFCSYNETLKFPEQCNIIYEINGEKIYINLRNNSLPLFTTETNDYWNSNINHQNMKISKINNKKNGNNKEFK